VANETSIVVDAATKAGPMCKLIVQAQQKAAEAMDTISVLHPYAEGVPTLGSLANTFFTAFSPPAPPPPHTSTHSGREGGVEGAQEGGHAAPS
jgi:hypothetical protein